MRVNVARASVLLYLATLTVANLMTPIRAAANPSENTSTSTSTTSLTSETSSMPTKVRRKMDWNLEFASEYESEGRDESLAVMTRLGLDLRFDFSETFAMVMVPEARFYSARAQDRFDSDNFEDRIGLREAYLSLQPLNGKNFSLVFRTGALSQGLSEQNFLISRRRSFPGAMAEAQYNQSLGGLSLAVQEAVPTSYSYNALRQDKEPMPGLRTTRVALNARLISDFQLQALVGQMSWRNLPSRIAYYSQRQGNSVDGSLAPTSRFVYGFATDVARLQLDYCPTCRWGGSVGVRRARNTLAPSDSADAQAVTAQISYRSRDLVSSLEVSSFFSESDVTPAAYSPSAYGNTNRQGYKTHFEIEIPSSELKITADWVQARAITATPFQNDFNSVYLGVETNGHWIQ